MPSSSQIYGTLNLPGKDTGLATLGDLAEMRDVQAQRQAQAQQAQAAAQKAQRDAQKEAAIQDVFHRNMTEYGPDHPTILKELYGIDPVFAGKYESDRRTQIKMASDEIDAEKARELKDMEFDYQMLRSAKTPQQRTFARQRVRDKKLLEFIGDGSDGDVDYDSKVGFLNDALLSAKDYDTKVAEVRKTSKDEFTELLNVANLAHDQEHWDEVFAEADAKGYGAKIRQLLKPEFSEGERELAGAYTQTPEQRGQAQSRKADDVRADLAAQRQAANDARTAAIQQGQLDVARGNLDVARGNLAARNAETQGGPDAKVTLTGAQKDDLIMIKDITGLIEEAKTLGDQIGWRGVGAGYTGSIASAAANLGIGSEESEELRNKIGNIQGTIAKLRGGTSFTANEQKLLDTYTPTINDGDMRIKAKLKSLDAFLKRRAENILAVASGNVGRIQADAGKDVSTVTRDELAALARRKGTSVEQEAMRAARAGYVIR